MTVHHFQPTQYHNTFGSHASILRIAPGDRVITTTIDAGGTDQTGKHVKSGPNPLTGPFYIEGAEAGDTLVVRLERLIPNRDWGYSNTMLSPNVVDPELARRLPPGQNVTWRIDLTDQTARPDDPLAKLGPAVLEPMLGCLGVAPATGQAISSATSGSYGGNMDYRHFRAGTTGYFPVYVPGALLFLGDGHALQGDGEVVGTGIETSFDVEFSVDLRKGKTIRWPRGEDADFIFTTGNARPLDQAVQHATSEMLAWLMEDYTLDLSEASTLLGMRVRYDLGNIFDPAYTMVCKLAKNILPPPGG